APGLAVPAIRAVPSASTRTTSNEGKISAFSARSDEFVSTVTPPPVSASGWLVARAITSLATTSSVAEVALGAFITGPEIYLQSGGQIDGFVDFIGSGGTYAGVTRALKQRDPDIRCFVVEPEGAALQAGQPVTHPAHPIQGGGYSIKDLQFLIDTPVDGYIQISGQTARQITRDLATKEGIFGGFSGGANVAAALQLLQNDMRGKTIAAVICDSGLKYLSTDLWT
ncbi:pyridoxal-phosphate dependent enzyme, partial [Paracoccaceae bacterium]|nr:pyridoxal-phosphate dependent enzyme [Paracoccaceae bacterium]